MPVMHFDKRIWPRGELVIVTSTKCILMYTSLMEKYDKFDLLWLGLVTSYQIHGSCAISSVCLFFKILSSSDSKISEDEGEYYISAKELWKILPSNRFKTFLALQNCSIYFVRLTKITSECMYYNHTPIL